MLTHGEKVRGILYAMAAVIAIGAPIILTMGEIALPLILPSVLWAVVLALVLAANVHRLFELRRNKESISAQAGSCIAFFLLLVSQIFTTINRI